MSRFWILSLFMGMYTYGLAIGQITEKTNDFFFLKERFKANSAYTSYFVPFVLKD